jgi:hypothetical protein
MLNGAAAKGRQPSGCNVISGWSEGPYPESRDSGFDAEPVIGPRFARTRWHRPEVTSAKSSKKPAVIRGRQAFLRVQQVPRRNGRNAYRV